MNYKRSLQCNDLDAFKIGGQPATPYDKIKAFIDIPTEKGGGSAYGGQWKPSKPEDEKFIGTSGEVKQSFSKKGDL